MDNSQLSLWTRNFLRQVRESRLEGGILEEDYEDYSKSEAEVDVECPSFDVDWSKEIHAKYKLRKDYFLTPVFTYGPNNQLRAFRESIILGSIHYFHVRLQAVVRGCPTCPIVLPALLNH